MKVARQKRDGWMKGNFNGNGQAHSWIW